jgi:hypothetical protein
MKTLWIPEEIKHCRDLYKEEKNPTKSGKQEVGIWRVQKRSIYVWYAIHVSHLYVPCSRPLVHLEISLSYCTISLYYLFLYPRSPKGEGGILFYLCPSVQDIFRCIFLSNCWWQKSDIWSQTSYRYTILWVAFLVLNVPVVYYTVHINVKNVLHTIRILN